jgi:riboflavin kinase/FMN adenylyltransferase
MHTISGKVIKGDGYGKKLGFPTVNLDSWVEKLPEAGIYCGDGIIDGTKYRAGIVVGPKNKVEAHLIGYDGDAYGKNVILTIKKFLREYKNFDTEEELINQIKKDIEQC